MIYQGPFHLHSPALGTRVQQLWLFAEILTENNDEEIFDKSFQISISIDGVRADHSTINLLPENESTNTTQHLKCHKQLCEEVMVLHLASLEYTHYILNIRFYGLGEFHKRYYMREIVFYFKMYNPAFTQMETWFRFIFLLATFVVTCWFTHSLRKYPSHDWAIEQRWLSVMLPMLLLYNDPLFPLRLVSASCFAPLMDSVFQATFFAGLMLSWLAQYHGLRQNDRGFVSFYLFKLVVVGSVWAPAMVVTVWQKYYAYYDPTFNYMMSPNYPIVKTMFFTGLAVYFLYLLILIVKAYSDLRNMPFFDVRLRCVSAGAGAAAALAGAVCARGWGGAALQDHWAARHPHDTSAPFMALYSLFNFDLYALAYLYSPPTVEPHETSITKDNPAFSMINDSDEDVIYGSDEDSRRPLNSHHRVSTEDI